MRMEYTLLDTSGVILSRQPDIVHEHLVVSFIGAPANSTAIFESTNGAMYRSLHGEICSLPAKELDGVFKVTVAVLDGSARPRKWVCEEFIAKKQTQGGSLIAPNDMNLPQRFVELKLENETIRRNQERLERRIKDLEYRFEKLLEGYDLT